MNNKYRIMDNTTAIILNRKDGTKLETIISTSDLEKAMEFPAQWCAQWNKQTQSYYVFGMLPPVGNRKRKIVKLHRWILEPPRELVVDHVNHDTLNNTRENLRIVTQGHNMQNKKGASKNSQSGIRGVGWNKKNKKWQARLQVNGKQFSIGYFENIKEAEKAIKEARRKYMPFSTMDYSEVV